MSKVILLIGLGVALLSIWNIYNSKRTHKEKEKENRKVKGVFFFVANFLFETKNQLNELIYIV